MGMVVIQPYISVSKLKKFKTKFLRCTGYLSSIKALLKQELLLTTTELSKLLTSRVLQLLKTCYRVL